MADFQLFINGEYVDAAAGETFTTTDPGTDQPIGEVAKADRADAARAIQAARTAFDEGPWPGMSGADRGARLTKLAELLEANAERFAEAEARDSGGTIKKATFADVPGAAGALRWFARMAAERPDEVALEGSPFPPSENYVRYEPYGVCTGIVPFNFPLLMACWKLGPALAAGNTSVIKPASFTSVTALMLGELAQEADLPPGVLNVIAGPGGTAGEELASNEMVDKVAFTGSTEVGRRIMQLASGTIKPVTLELGGKSANIVLDDADLDIAAACVLFGTFFHNGQVCESGTRALVHRSVYDEFVSLLVDRAGKMVIGNQLDFDTDLGPMVSRAQAETVERYVALGREEVGEPICGGRAPDGLPAELATANFYQPTIFAGVDNASRIAQEEIFGPVLCVIPFETDDEAVAIANDSIYGLGGGVQSANVERAQAIAARLKTGTVWINDYHMISPERPFGGYKQSGIGRELGTAGFDIYRQAKHIHTNPSTGRDGYMHFAALSANI
ncbi:aldehyde dehydrogenase family protein [Iamia sp.]|uniref:aldehyde dehydrogenase family protein n=1 Tax=Iamia sp. TaxID=2722710 RepID=UPI002B722BD8|nr:aldehyde dehydrogenase family protein [Iamia sp.]HXH55664.1 aldehyde dehydrogenase family protein [Iamia sp.]